VQPVLAGTTTRLDPYDDGLLYTHDLGLIAPTKPVRIANPIYREVIARVLGAETEENVLADPRAFVLPDGQLDFDLLLREFAAFWVGNGITPVRSLRDPPGPPGGGHVEREYGVGRGRIDLLVRWPYRTPAGKRAYQREAVELKVWRPNDADPLAEGLAQLDAYLDQHPGHRFASGPGPRVDLDTGVLVVFDRRPGAAPIAERTRFDKATSPTGRAVTVLRA
jgi:hypothetical protein